MIEKPDWADELVTVPKSLFVGQGISLSIAVQLLAQHLGCPESELESHIHALTREQASTLTRAEVEKVFRVYQQAQTDQDVRTLKINLDA